MKPPPPLERDITQAIRDGLTWLGWIVCSTQQYRKRGDYQGTTTTVGTPDLFCARPELHGRWIALEVKRPGRYGRLSPEQKRLVDAGLVHIVTSFEEARAVVEATER